MPNALSEQYWLGFGERMLSRRDFTAMTLAGLPLATARAAAKINYNVNGVMVGAQSYSFRDRPLDKAIEGYKEVGLGLCELWQGHVEPQDGGQGARQALRKWRLETPL